jgi:hypothetical protein
MRAVKWELVQATQRVNTPPRNMWAAVAEMLKYAVKPYGGWGSPHARRDRADLLWVEGRKATVSESGEVAVDNT